MSKFTSGKWEAQSCATKYIELWKVVAPDMTVAIGIMREHDARLIASAPEMYKMLEICSATIGNLSIANPVLSPLRQMIEKLLARIDGKDAEHE